MASPPKLSPQQRLWREEHRHDSQVPSIITVNVILPVLITVVTVARVASRRISKAGLGLDDYTLLAAVVGARPREGDQAERHQTRAS